MQRHPQQALMVVVATAENLVYTTDLPIFYALELKP